MKPTRFLLGALLLLPLAASAAERSDQGSPALQVQVDVPASVDPLHEDDVIEVFVDAVREAFRRRGYDGRIDELDWADDVKPDAPLLAVRLLRWERNRTGGIDCTFGASVRPVGGKEQSLGTFTQTELGLAITNRWTLHEAFRDAAERAAEQMYRRLAKLDVIPGIAPRKD